MSGTFQKTSSGRENIEKSALRAEQSKNLSETTTMLQRKKIDCALVRSHERFPCAPKGAKTVESRLRTTTPVSVRATREEWRGKKGAKAPCSTWCESRSTEGQASKATPPRVVVPTRLDASTLSKLQSQVRISHPVAVNEAVAK